MIDVLISPIRTLVSMAGPAGPRRGAQMSELGIMHDVALGIDLGSGCISFIGPWEEAWNSREELHRHGSNLKVVNADNNIVIPGFIDSHTHLVFAGDRADEFYRRASGVSYATIAAEGGGIRRTMDATRQADEAELRRLLIERLHRMMLNGTTAFEIKSGYGLSVDSERLALRIISGLRQDSTPLIRRTYMGAHLVPPEFAEDRAAYVSQIVDELGYMNSEDLCDYYDIFVDPLAFSQAEAQRIVDRGRELGLPLRLHADEFGDDGTAAWAVANGAVSADHLGGIGEGGIAALAGSDTIATLLPGTMFFSGHGHYAPARRMIDAGVAVALATDLNPGSSLLYSMPFVMTLAALQMQMSAAECLTAATVNAAHALGIADRTGTLEVGKRADLLILDCDSIEALPYHVGADLIRDVYIAGRYVKKDYKHFLS